MELTVLAGSYSTIVGLIANFVASRAQREILDIKDFIEWLRIHGHEQILEQIQRNTETTVSIKASLAEGRDELMARLAAIEGLLALHSSGQGPLGALALSLARNAVLSPQSIEILVSFERAQAGKALLLQMQEGSQLFFLDGVGSAGFNPSDPRFFEADLDDLVGNQLCSLSYNSNREKVFQLTRRGASIARSVIGVGLP